MVKETKDMRRWVNNMLGPLPVREWGAGTAKLRLDDGHGKIAYCITCGAARLANELKTYGGNCAECSGF